MGLPFQQRWRFATTGHRADEPPGPQAPGNQARLVHTDCTDCSGRGARMRCPGASVLCLSPPLVALSLTRLVICSGQNHPGLYTQPHQPGGGCCKYTAIARSGHSAATEGGQPKRDSSPKKIFIYKKEPKGPIFCSGQLEPTWRGAVAGGILIYAHIGGYWFESRCARAIFFLGFWCFGAQVAARAKRRVVRGRTGGSCKFVGGWPRVAFFPRFVPMRVLRFIMLGDCWGQKHGFRPRGNRPKTKRAFSHRDQW